MYVYVKDLTSFANFPRLDNILKNYYNDFIQYIIMYYNVSFSIQL